LNNLISCQKRGSFQTSSVTQEEVKESYQAIKLHFSSKNYNYKKYNGKVKKQNFNDIIPYALIAKGKYKTDFPDFFIPGLFQNPKINIEYFLTDDYNALWKYWTSYQKAPKYFFERELEEIKNYLEKKNNGFNEIFKIEENTLPMIYKFIIKNEVSPQTVLYIDQVLNFINPLESKISEKIFYPILNQRLNKMKAFIKNQETSFLKKIMKNVFFP